MFHKCYSIIRINRAAESSKPRVMLRDQRRKPPSKNFSISRAILLGFLRSLARAIQYEANKINRRREDWPIGSRAVNMLRDLRRRVRGPARHVAPANMRAEVRARSEHVCTTGQYDVNNRLRDGSLENATCARGTNRAKINAWRGKSRLFSRFSSVSCVH